MSAKGKLALWLAALMAQSVWAESPVAKVKIEEFSVEPLRVKAGDEVHIRWRIRNVGGKAVVIRPRVGFTRPGMSHYVDAQQEQKLEPGREFPFTAKTTFPFRTDWGESLPGSHVIETLIMDTEAGISLGGFAYDQPLVYGRPEYVPPGPPSEPSIVAYPQKSLYFAGEDISIIGQVMRAKVRKIHISGATDLERPVKGNGHFEFKFSPRQIGLQRLVLQAKGVPAVLVEAFVAPDELAFPRLFGTDQHYEVGLFCGTSPAHWSMQPYWAKQLGINFVILPKSGMWESDPDVDEMLSNADNLGVTFGLVTTDAPRLAENSIQYNGKQSSYMNVLSQEFLTQFADRLVDFVSKMRYHKSLRYMLLMPEQFNLRQLEGYNPVNLERFAKEVMTKPGPQITLPGFNDAPAWYKLLRDDQNLWEEWLSWRERRWTEWMVQVRARMQAIKPDIEFGTAECHRMDRGLWNLGMLVAAGLTCHAPIGGFPDAGNPYWATMICADWYRKGYGFTPPWTAMSVWWDTDYDPEQILSGLFAPVKSGGSRVPTWCDSGFRAGWKYLDPEFGKGRVRKIQDWAEVMIGDEALQSPTTDMLTGVSGRRKSHAVQVAAGQIGQLPYKDRFDLFEQHGGKLPLEFALSWQEGDEPCTAKSKDGLAAGNPHDSVYAAVQDWHPNGYVEMLVFNDVQQNYRTKKVNPVIRDPITVYTFEPGSLHPRQITVTIKCDDDIIPFLDGQPWTYYERKDDALVINSIPFDAQQVQLLQLVRCGRDLPHVTRSSVGLKTSMFNTVERRLWLRVLTPASGQKQQILINCVDWDEPDTVQGGVLEHYDKGTRRAVVRLDENTQTVALVWRTGIPVRK